MFLKWILTSIGEQIVELTTFAATSIYTDTRLLSTRTYDYLTTTTKTEAQLEQERNERKGRREQQREMLQQRKTLFESRKKLESKDTTQKLDEYKNSIRELLRKMDEELAKLNRLFISLFNGNRIALIRAEKAALEPLLETHTYQELHLLTVQAKEKPDANFNNGFGSDEVLDAIIKDKPEPEKKPSLWRAIGY